MNQRLTTILRHQVGKWRHTKLVSTVSVAAPSLAVGILFATLLDGRLVAQVPALTELNRGAAAAALAAPDAANDAKSDAKLGSDWVRLHYDDNDRLLGMQTAIVRYVPDQAGGPGAPAATVDLVAAVHVGDAAYYADLNRRFNMYDAMLYELVAPEGTVVPRGRGSSNAHPLGALQNGMKSMLALEHQLEKIDYTKKNFVHADMSPDQFLQAMKDRNEDFLQMFLRLLGQSVAQQSKLAADGESPEFELFAAMFATDRPRRLKVVLAKQLAETESFLVSFGGEEGSVLITERNKMALKVLKEQLAAGKKNLAIFYGAGHLADMDQRLRRDFSMRPAEITWLTAWDLTPKP